MELCKENFMNLNKQFISSCVTILKEDNSSCLAPAVFDYISHTMNIINRVQTTPGLPQVKRLLGEIKKRQKILNKKYHEVKAKQRKISGKKCRTKSSKVIKTTTPFKNSNTLQQNNHPPLPKPLLPPPQQTPMSKPAKPAMPAQPAAVNQVEKIQKLPEPLPFYRMPITPIPKTDPPTQARFELPKPDFEPFPYLTKLPPPMVTSAPLLTWITNAPISTSVPNGIQVPPASAQTSTQDDDEPYEPPAVQFTPVVEKDALYSKRCKLFEKRNTAYVNRGVGVLYVNRIETDKYQLVIRADNTLGTALLNLRLNSSLPFQTSGANFVMTVDPSADKGKGASVLIKVKTSADAKELFEKLSYYKKLSPS